MEKGTTNNPNGRPKGKPNKVTKALKDRIQIFLEKSWPTVEKDFKNLDPKDRIALYERMLKYVIPTQKESSVSVDIDGINKDQPLFVEIIKSASDEELQAIYKGLEITEELKWKNKNTYPNYGGPNGLIKIQRGQEEPIK